MLVQSVTDYAIFMLDQDGFVINWNVGAERIKGYKADEIVGQHFSRFYTEQDRAGGIPQRALATAAREGRYEAGGWGYTRTAGCSGQA
jgi:PAS domain S-box-containing protein